MHSLAIYTLLVSVSRAALLHGPTANLAHALTRTGAVHMKGDSGRSDLKAAFAARLKETTGTDAPRAAKRRTDANEQAEEKKKAPKNRPGARLDLANRPQNFFRGLAERDEKLADLRDRGFTDEQAELMSADDKRTFLIGFGLFAAILLGRFGFTQLDASIRDQAYQQAIQSSNTQLTRCLDDAFFIAERSLCYIKYPN
uniref:Uncharacterized protein n=1 Tax=Haptolina ericina TaxID=156174 RepID=A0A7S3FM35_9EUKA|mmetsp:Transcript_9295/g.20930  ORF Transcript_9295/g.20930 Transcript_9295/m.20930 type:complete len:199 (+) Transcript_9295:108-704(+)